jgi:DNA-binding NtrC family response regulator
MAKRCRVLIVEDNKELQSLLQNALSLEGYDVSITGTTPIALHQINLRDYDIVILGLTSSGGADGYAAALRAKAPGIGVILVSGDPLQDRKSAAHAVLMKPFRVTAMSELIRETLEQTKADCEAPQGPPRRIA